MKRLLIILTLCFVVSGVASASAGKESYQAIAEWIHLTLYVLAEFIVLSWIPGVAGVWREKSGTPTDQPEVLRWIFWYYAIPSIFWMVAVSELMPTWIAMSVYPIVGFFFSFHFMQTITRRALSIGHTKKIAYVAAIVPIVGFAIALYLGNKKS